MTRPPRGLAPDEALLWARLAATVKPLHPKNRLPLANVPPEGDRRGMGPVIAKASPPEQPKRVKGRVPAPRVAPVAPPPPPSAGLDSHWERRLARSATTPDFTLDLHGHTLDSAHARLDSGLTQARMMEARLVLVITGKPRPVDAADRGERRGAIRAKIIDWLAAGQHASAIAAVRPAHRRHGGEGAIYLVLRR